MTTYRLRYPTPARAAAPALDRCQQAVVDHTGGPLLVLAGPGTGKTTTLVEAIVDRIERRGVPAESVLALTFSRKAAEQLRDRVTARLGRTMATTLSSTFHSFAYSLVRRHTDKDPELEPLRLLSAPEQDVALRELLRAASAEGVSHGWPPSLRPALLTRGFGKELQALLARARELGLEPEDLERLGKQEGRADWVAAGSFLAEYLHVMDFKGALDYTELVHRAAAILERPEVRSEVRAQYSWVFVDEYQDTDPRQVALLRALAGDGRNLVAVGDPDQSIYAFRGADVRGILDFPTDFPTADGQRAPVVALRTARRFGPTLLRASRHVAAGIPAAGALDGELLRRFRRPVAESGEHGDGAVEVALFANARAETDHIADLLRRAHLEDGVPWSQMAVLVRSGRASIPPLRRALTSAGVPVEVAGDELPLVRDPSVAPLLAALEAVVDLERLSVDRARELLLSPLGGLDAAEVRRLARQLRELDRETHGAVRPPLPSEELLRRALCQPGDLLVVDGPTARKARRLAELLAAAARQLRRAGTAEEVLWTLWSGTPWPQQLRANVERGGGAARLAHRDLDAVCALFEVAARAEEKQGHTGVASFLDELTAQQIPADTLAERGVRGEAVRLLTAHRSKGLEWRLVVVAGVQEGVWPSLRRRGSLLEPDRVGRDGVLPPVTVASVLAEERRLFYVATTRARERLVVTAVSSTDDDGEQPSRFLAELGAAPGEVRGRPARPMSLSGVVAELRRAAGDDSRPALQRAAAERLARLAQETHHDEPLVRQADPGSWWGIRSRSAAQQPLREPGEPLVVSASALDAILGCPARWFLEREAAGSSAATLAQGFGLVVHALADHAAKGRLTDAEEMIDHVDRIWSQLQFDTPWSREKQRAEVHEVIRRFVAWHNGRPGRRLLASEQPFSASVTLPNGEEVVLRGYADRLELDADGNVVVVDFKTSKSAATQEKVRNHAQLGLYQLAMDNGAAAELAGPHARSGGAELVQLRVDDSGLPKVQPQGPQAPDADGRKLAEVQLMEAAAMLRSEQVTARANPYCDFCSFHAVCPVKGSGTVLS